MRLTPRAGYGNKREVTAAVRAGPPTREEQRRRDAEAVGSMHHYGVLGLGGGLAGAAPYMAASFGASPGRGGVGGRGGFYGGEAMGMARGMGGISGLAGMGGIGGSYGYA